MPRGSGGNGGGGDGGEMDESDGMDGAHTDELMNEDEEGEEGEIEEEVEGEANTAGEKGEEGGAEAEEDAASVDSAYDRVLVEGIFRCSIFSLLFPLLFSLVLFPSSSFLRRPLFPQLIPSRYIRNYG